MSNMSVGIVPADESIKGVDWAVNEAVHSLAVQASKRGVTPDWTTLDIHGSQSLMDDEPKLTIHATVQPKK